LRYNTTPLHRLAMATHPNTTKACIRKKAPITLEPF